MKFCSSKSVSFNEYLNFLRESMQNLADYYNKIGEDKPDLSYIREGLQHSDPFVIYKASIAASIMLDDPALYH